MNIDKTTFMGVLQAISSVLLVFGITSFDDPDVKEAIWMSWGAFVGVIAGFKGYFSKSTDDGVDPKEDLELSILKSKARKAEIETKMVYDTYRAEKGGP